MKRLLTLLIIICLAFTIPHAAFASPTVDEEVIYLDDGRYIVITIDTAATRASNTRTGNKSYDCYNSNNELEWKAVLSGTFTYNGTSATCTASSCAVTIYDGSFYEVSKSATKSGNTAYCSFTIGRKILGITVAKNDYSISLSCDKNGVLS